MHTYEIRITANRQEEDGEAFRIDRLHEVLGYAVAYAELKSDISLTKNLLHLHDHKGTLSVLWRNTPTKVQADAISKAWASEIGDRSDSIDTYIHPQEIDM